MRDEMKRLRSWRDNIMDAAKSLDDSEYINCAYKLGFTLQGLMIAIAEIEKDTSNWVPEWEKDK